VKNFQTLICCIIILFITAPLSYAAGGGEKSEPAEHFVKLSTIALPMTRNGLVLRYIYVSVRINLKPNSDIINLRKKEPYFRDRLVRLAHATSFIREDASNQLDEDKLKMSLMPEFERIAAGQGRIDSLEITNISAKKLRP
jgi:flagellar basal body-associated protein FliL